MPKGKIRGIEEPELDRPKPVGYQQIVITPSKWYHTKTVPKELLAQRVKAMIAESKRYIKSTLDRERDLCMNVIPLEENDGFPRRLSLILDLDGIPNVPGKPCPNNSLKSSPYCRSCKKALKGKQE